MSSQTLRLLRGFPVPNNRLTKPKIAQSVSINFLDSADTFTYSPPKGCLFIEQTKPRCVYDKVPCFKNTVELRFDPNAVAQRLCTPDHSVIVIRLVLSTASFLLQVCVADLIPPLLAISLSLATMTVAGIMRQYQVVGRKAPTEDHPNPEAYRMIIFAPNAVIAKSKFWYYMHQFRKMKKTTGEILDCVEIVEKNNRIVKNYGIWLRYSSRSGTHNMYREYRDVALTGAVSQLYDEMAGRHRTRPRSIQIIRTATVAAKDLKRPNGMQFAQAKVKFPLPHRVASGKRGQKALSSTTYSTVRPTTFFG